MRLLLRSRNEDSLPWTGERPKTFASLVAICSSPRALARKSRICSEWETKGSKALGCDLSDSSGQSQALAFLGVGLILEDAFDGTMHPTGARLRRTPIR